jgi:hypothetical protein
MRLKSGLSPIERVEDITIDLPKHLAYLNHVLDSSNQRQRLGLVLGSYGAGKTHFLQLAKRVALKQGYAVAELGQDTGLGSLAQPQRHVYPLLASLEAPAPYGRLVEWINCTLEDASDAEGLRRIRRILPGAPQAVDKLLNRIARSTSFNRPRQTLEYLTGALLVGKSAAPYVRIQAYALIRFWELVCAQALGLKGIVLLVDELENLFSNAVYWNILSRRSGYRALSFYTEQSKDILVVGALSPTGWDALQGEIRSNRELLCAGVSEASYENVDSLCRRVAHNVPYELPRFSKEAYTGLFERLAQLHREARDYSSEWLDTANLAPACGPEMTPRIFAKSVISALDNLWFQKALSASQVNC